MSAIAKTHISLNVRDVEKSAAFYEAFFGIAPHKKRPGYVNFALENPPLKLAMQEHDTTPSVGSLAHFGIQMDTPEEVAQTRERLEKSGLVSFDEGDTVCCYARQDKVWVTDPDGNSWEVYVLLDEMNDADDHEFEQGRIVAADDACCVNVSATGKATGVKVPLGIAGTSDNLCSPTSGCC